MLDAVRNDYKLPCIHDGFMVAEFHAQGALDDKKQFIFIFVMMTHELAFELDRFDLAIIHFADDARVAVVGEQAELLA
jgi:hypothetical protein